MATLVFARPQSRFSAFLNCDAKLRVLKSGTQSEIELTICEGKFHQVKRMFQAVGKEVVYLKRLQMGTLILDESLKPGEYRELTEQEIADLCFYQ